MWKHCKYKMARLSSLKVLRVDHQPSFQLIDLSPLNGSIKDGEGARRPPHFFYAYQEASNHFNTPCPAAYPVEKQAVSR